MKLKHEYMITSERALRRSDESENTFYSDSTYEVGDVIVLDGLRWTADKVVRQKGDFIMRQMLKMMIAIMYLCYCDFCYKLADYHIKIRNKHHLKALKWKDKGDNILQSWQLGKK